jgi:tight adherence protein C
MSTRLLAASALAVWTGATLLLAELRWFSRRTLTDRLRPYLPSSPDSKASTGALSVQNFRDVIGPLARDLGERVSHLLGVSEELSARLRRTHSPLDVTAVRTRQLAWSGLALALGVVVTQAVTLPAVAALVVVIGAPLLAFLIAEQRIGTASRRWQERTFLELPIVTEQLGMLLAAGYSLGSALNQLAARGEGACQTDLRVVCARTQQGLTEMDALREWADRVRVTEVDRLVDVLALNREAGDLGRLISEEARSTRREVQRRTLEAIERRGQQVWIPVTVAALLPGVLFIAVPFIEALRLFSGG